MALRGADYWIEQYRVRQAYWCHDGNPRRPHARLTSGKHSNGFFDSRPVIADGPLLQEAAADIVDRFEAWMKSLRHVDRVVGPATGATKLAEAVSNEIGRRRGKPCAWASPVKVEEGGVVTRMVFTDPTRKPLPSEAVLPVEDVVTTGRSVELAVTAVKAEGAAPFTGIGTIVNRSGLTHIKGQFVDRLIMANLTQPMDVWEAADCPLCQVGSLHIRPKEGNNWELLNAEY